MLSSFDYGLVPMCPGKPEGRQAQDMLWKEVAIWAEASQKGKNLPETEAGTFLDYRYHLHADLLLGRCHAPENIRPLVAHLGDWSIQWDHRLHVKWDGFQMGSQLVTKEGGLLGAPCFPSQPAPEIAVFYLEKVEVIQRWDKYSSERGALACPWDHRKTKWFIELKIPLL